MFTPIPANSHIANVSAVQAEPIDYAASLRESASMVRHSKRDASSKSQTLARKAVRALKYGGFKS